MRNETSLFKRSLAALLCFVMVLGMVPVFGVAPVAFAEENVEEGGDATGGENTEVHLPDIEGNYITMPITIRDFAADGMLFEYNETNQEMTAEGETWSYVNTGYVGDEIAIEDAVSKYSGYLFNYTHWDINYDYEGYSADYTGMRVFDTSTSPNFSEGNGQWWHCIIVDEDGNVLQVLPVDQPKDSGAFSYTAAMTNTGGDYSIWAWSNYRNFESNDYYYKLAEITDANKHNYRVSFVGYDLYIGHKYYLNPTTVNLGGSIGNTGIRIYEAGQLDSGEVNSMTWWHCVILNSSNQVIDVVPNGTSKESILNQYMWVASDGTTSGNKAVFAWSDDTNRVAYDAIACINNENKGEFLFEQKTTYTSQALLNIKRTRNFHVANTRSFGLLFSNENDYIDNLYGENTIANTELVQHNPTKEGAEAIYECALKDVNGVEYAVQESLGSLVRTNLVGKELDAEGKPIYTPATVEFLATYMADVMNIPYKDANGAYYTYHVMGAKMFKDNTDGGYNFVNPGDASAQYDLAEVLRRKVNGSAETDKLGTYTASKTKFENGGLRTYDDVATWYDAAYFLLHNTWRDSSVDFMGESGRDGYGKPMDRYENLHLVEQTKEDGSVYYVFNAKYDDSCYDYQYGEIYNTQTKDFTIASNRDGVVTDGTSNGTGTGNPLPVGRFDPLGPSGAGVWLGYGKEASPDTYGDLYRDNEMSWADYYDSTNYHLSLEGHAKFVYHEDSNQYFTFTGDDDVYLYINNIRVLDIGAAHSISQIRVDINKVASACGLVDGGTYDFDFFFLERHGTAANFGIETNIQLAAPELVTTKEGYQKGGTTGYNGYVDPNESVGYSFTVQNNGDVTVENLAFDDQDIGIYLGYNECVLNSDSQWENMYLVHWKADGTYKEFIGAGQLNEETVKEKLATGLLKGEKLGIYGFRYLIPQNSTAEKKGWTSDGSFTNTVHTSGQAFISGKTVNLSGTADWKVKKSLLSITPVHVYDWVTKGFRDTNWTQHGVALSKTELLAPLTKNAGVTTSGATIALCNASGSTTSLNINPCVTVQGDTFLYKAKEPGMDTVYYKVTGVKINGETHPDIVMRYDVYTYATINNIYVLDYGLPVELNGENFGFQVNDHLSVTQNTHKPVTTLALDGFTANKKVAAYGEFVQSGDSVKYVPTKIINGVDSFDVTIQVRETPPEGVTITDTNLKFYGVDMTEKVETAPANVVYYEENFANNKEGGITYVENGGNDWVQYETIKDGESVAGIEQSDNPNDNYGYDEEYVKDKEGQLISDKNTIGTEEDKLSFELDNKDLDTTQKEAIDALNKYLGYQGGGDSNGTVKELVVRTEDDVMQFCFVGTGFEIISRTTDSAYAVLEVRVEKITRNEAGEITEAKVVRGKPVITESIGGDLYQVPIISFKNLTKAEYRVTVKAAASTSTKTRILFIDGIRIYGPLGEDEALKYYNPEEYHADIFEVKTLIEKGKTIYANASDSNTHFKDNDLKLVYGTTLIEDQSGELVVTSISNVNQYMEIGPNNELYLDGIATNSVIAFFLRPIEKDANGNEYPEGARTLEIGAHRKADTEALDRTSSVNMVYGSTADKITYATAEDDNFYLVSSGTELYYTIDIDQLTYDEYNGGYLVMIGTNGTDYDESLYDEDVEQPYDFLALTNIKVAGYEIVSVEEMVIPPENEDGENGSENSGEEGNETKISPNSILYQPLMLMKAFAGVDGEENEEVMIPVNENLSILSAKFRADSVVAGKTVTLTVRTNPEAAYVVITDANGNVFEPTKCTSKIKDGDLIFTLTWKATGYRGDKFTYIIRVYDENDLASVNTETVKLTIQ